MLGEFVAVEIEGAATDSAYRLPAAALTSRDQLWVVDDSQLVARRVEVLGRDADAVVVSAFDTADGVVAIPPPDARAGLVVDPVFNAGRASTGGAASASK